MDYSGVLYNLKKKKKNNFDKVTRYFLDANLIHEDIDFG
jgi:hypothetical protein